MNSLIFLQRGYRYLRSEVAWHLARFQRTNRRIALAVEDIDARLRAGKAREALRLFRQNRWLMAPNSPLVQELCSGMIARRITRDPIEILRRSVKRECALGVVHSFILGLFQIRHYAEIEEVLESQLAKPERSDLTSKVLLSELYIRLLQQTERYREGLKFAEAAQKSGLPIRADQYIGICLAALGRHKEAVSRFLAVDGDKFSIRGRSFFIRSLFELGDFDRILSESSKLNTVVGYEFSSYAHIYFEDWSGAARNLLELVRLYPAAHRPHVNLAARDPANYLPTSIDISLSPEVSNFRSGELRWRAPHAYRTRRSQPSSVLCCVARATSHESDVAEAVDCVGEDAERLRD